MSRLSAIVAAGLMAAAAGTVQAKEKITIGELSWDGSLAIQAVMKNLMENRLDVEVEYLAADQTVMFKSMDKGDGGVDVHPDVWMTAQQANVDKFVTERGTVRLNDTGYVASDGLFIPGFIQDQHGIRTVADLSKPGVAELFDVDGDGKGDFWPGAPGWGGTNINMVKAKSYGFDQTFNAFQVSDAVFKGQLEAAFKKQKGIVFYYWTPEWIHSVYDLRQLEEPAFTGYASEDMKDSPDYKADGCWNMADVKQDADWLENSSITCGSPPPQVRIAYSAALEARAPKVAALLKGMTLEVSDLNDWILKIAKEKQDPDAVAAAWIEANPAKVDAWMAGVE